MVPDFFHSSLSFLAEGLLGGLSVDLKLYVEEKGGQESSSSSSLLNLELSSRRKERVGYHFKATVQLFRKGQ